MYTYVIIHDEALIRKGTIKKLEPLLGQLTCIGETGHYCQCSGLYSTAF